MPERGPPDPADIRALRALAVVPARIGSQRLARKMLLRETGRYLFEHTAKNALAARVFERVVVATDSDEILAAADAVGVEALRTRADHGSGTDRVHEAHELLRRTGGSAWDVVVNIQGDEPELVGPDLARLLEAFGEPGVELATLCGPISSEVAAAEASVVKVVCDARGDALYFSRSQIPSRTHSRPGAAGLAGLARHVGVYAFRPQALARFCALPPGRLEAQENLEQLRWLEAGGRIRVIPVRQPPLGIDTREDYDAFVARERARTTSRTT
jgi:3-deoxy-manno-octulosonate cytidylyltransferase (CMP-KDO synthetase)